MKICQLCSKTYIPKVIWQKYCSSKCRNHNPNKSQKTKTFQKRRREAINNIKLSLGCTLCGYNSHPAALQFNHIKGHKSFNISQDPKRKWEDIIAEIAKCEVLCANCHSIHSYENKHGWTKGKVESAD